MDRSLNVLTLLVAFVVCVNGRPPVGLHSKAAIGHLENSLPRIIGGEDATDGQYPWTISIQFDGSLGWQHWCGGIIIKDNYAITAAQCVYNRYPFELRAYAGLLWLNDTQATNAQLLYVDSIVAHASYSPFALGLPYDIAVIRFNSTFNFAQANIEAALLPPHESGLFNHAGCYINGWGRYSTENQLSQIMQYVQIPVILNSDCADLVYAIANAQIFDSHVCVFSDPPGHGACNGDTGAPLNCHESESGGGPLYAAGIASWTVQVNDNCDPYYPSVYTRTSNYLTWIEDNTQ